MSNIATTIVQSKQLFALGLSPESADMFYDDWIDHITGELFAPSDGSSLTVGKRRTNQHLPAWSLSALLEVMPKPDLYRETADLWVCVTIFKEGSFRGFGETAIEAACDVITKMFGRGYLKKKGGENESEVH